MKPTTKAILAKEILILIGVVIIITLTWLTIFLISTNINYKYNNSILSLNEWTTKLDSLKKWENNPNPPTYWFAPSSDFVFERSPKFRPPIDAWEVLDKYKPFKNSPNISNNLNDFCQARENLMEIHKAIIYTDNEKFYQDNRDFNTFILNLNKNSLTKIYNGITGKSKDYIKIVDIPNSFNNFLINIGYDTLTYKPLLNIQILDYEKSVDNCKQKIAALENEKNKIEKSSFLHLDIMRIIFILSIILFGLAYPIRGVFKLTFWAVNTLRNQKE